MMTIEMPTTRPLSIALPDASSPSTPSTVSTPGSTRLGHQPLLPSTRTPSDHAAMSGSGFILPKSEFTQARPQMSLTSKTWEIPPRPKPGRKRATDTPPTKRQAQNRVAQRNFRDRRNALVSELEDQITAEKTDRDKMEAHMSSLETELQNFKSQCEALESALATEKLERAAEVEALKRQRAVNSLPSALSLMQPNLLAQQLAQYQRAPLPAFPSRSYSTQSNGSVSILPSVSGLPLPAATPEIEDGMSNVPIGCGQCTIGSRCACLEAALDVQELSAGLVVHTKRALTPDIIAPEKRFRGSNDMEIDFSTAFSQSLATSAPAVADTCGFCEDGTYCACADAADATESVPIAAPTLPLPIPAFRQHQTQTPPPSEGEIAPLEVEIMADGAVKLPGVRSLDRCGPGGPGTCEQCQNDPVSGLFCRLIAAKLDNNKVTKPDVTSGEGGCCGSRGVGGGCCRQKGMSATSGSDGSRRTQAEVETAGIMSSMLKVLDRRFGRGQ